MVNKDKPTVECKICNSTSNYIFQSKVLDKYLVNYFQCSDCRFIQTEDPFWLNEAYSSAIGLMDVGLLYRNSIFSNTLPAILERFSTPEDSFLDYGGGYGVFGRLMRDKGFDFFHYDKYCENLFMKFFELTDYKLDKFKALTTFEVFEHLPNPIEEISRMWEFSDIIIFSTELQPIKEFMSDADWWYFVPAGGQHVSLYHEKTLNKLGEKFNCSVYSNGTNLHILTKVEFENPFIQKKPASLFNLLYNKLKMSKKEEPSQQRCSLLMSDFEYCKEKLKK